MISKTNVISLKNSDILNLIIKIKINFLIDCKSNIMTKNMGLIPKFESIEYINTLTYGVIIIIMFI